MTIKALKRAGAILLCSTAMASAAFAPLKAQSTRTGIDITASVETANNPVLTENDADLTLAGRIEIRPFLQTSSEASTFRLEAFASAREFASDYDLEDRYGATAQFATRVSERVELFANAGIYTSNGRLSSIINQPGTLVTDPTITDPTVVALPIDRALGNDITLIGADGRTTTITADVGIEVKLTDRLSFGADAGYQDVSLSQFPLQEYDSYNTEAALTYQVSDRTSVGVFGGYRNTNYDDINLADAQTYIGALNLAHQLDESWSINLSGGLARTRIEETPISPGRNVTGFTSRVGLCNRGTRRNACISYRRSPLPTSFGGVRNSDTLGLSYSETVSERDSISVGANYTTTAASLGGIQTIPAVDLAGVNASYNRSFNERLSGYVFAGVSRLYRDDVQTDPSISIGIGLRLRIGSRR
jgi:hypothetical protein